MRPKILCLHGWGTNAEIFQIQSRRLAALLEPHFELVYINGPAEASPGPGVLPFFEGSGPFYGYLNDSSAAAEEAAGGWAEGDLDKLVSDFRREGPFVGILAFSQGAKAAWHLLRRLEEESAAADAGRSLVTPPNSQQRRVGFVVAVCGTAPYFQSAPTADIKRAAAAHVVTGVDTIHVIGDDDLYRAESEALVGFFDAPSRLAVRFPGAHHMPADHAFNASLANLIVHTFDAT
ncbi:serine hydrolase FSH [Lasiosphaeria miniovina]|uniref:Serine hydrolase FSH n=1 Tax=Lasiosphaeria miniovina TaxID=1954250 RepID=A0AA40DYI6_9PEZI|nr:serine hydrolase FSH [Lasiosphaeria miniovina]KAK0717681.1 serine hydrolase FSH [Lasiosphaeria miniovina]